jgi:cysteinyl-tRNA synthetase
MNITDIDDKSIRDSVAAGKSLLEFTQYYTDAFMQDIEKLSILPADKIDPISNLVPEMVRMINTLLRRWHAYISDDGSVYFKVKSFKKYGELAHLDMDGMKEWVRIDNDEYEKDNVWDFALWKAWDKWDWENFWEGEFENNPVVSLSGETAALSPDKGSWGVILKWRPGWHIECSACAMKHLGPEIDLHMWGIDLLFPHHQNEVAQTECCTRKTFSKYWAHHGHLTIDGAKMSKSKNNFYTLRDLEEKICIDPLPMVKGYLVPEGAKISPELLYRAVRLNFINGKYRDNIDFSFDKIKANFNTLRGIDQTLKNLKNYSTDLTGVSKEFSEYMQEIIGMFQEALEDDFAIPEALWVMFTFQKFVNSNIAEWLLSQEEVVSVIDMYKTFDSVFAIMDFSILENNDEDIPEVILEKFEARNKAKKDKNFEQADILRDEILEAGYTIVDDRQGIRLEKM